MPTKNETNLIQLAAVDLGRLGRFVRARGENETINKEARIAPAKLRATAKKGGTVVVFPIWGIVGHRAHELGWYADFSTEYFSKQFTQALNDPDIKAIVLDVDSPGGTVPGVKELSDLIFAAREKKPIIAIANSLAASAAYWIASAAEELVVTPSGEVGSIGVYAVHASYAGYYERFGIKPTVIKAGKYKAEGNPFEELAQDAQERIQADIDHYYNDFVSAVARNRNVTPASVKSGFGEGRTVVAPQAVKAGMADRVETLPETLARLGVDFYGSQESSRQFRADGERSLINVKHDFFLLTTKE